MITVYRFGVHYRWTPPPELVEQLRLAHDLREDLVTLQLDHEAAVRDVWSSYPQVAVAEAELTAATEDADRLVAALAKERSDQRTKRVTGPLADELAAARKRAKAARVARREAIAAVRDEAKVRLDELSAALKVAAKATYAEYAQGRGLYWATYNDVLDHHRVAIGRIRSDRAAGKPAALRHHRRDGSGSIAVQLQRSATDPPRSPSTLASGSGKWRNVLSLPWVRPDEWDLMSRAERRHAGRVPIRMRCGAGHIEVPVQMHRMLPPDADVTGARLTVRRVAGGIRAHITVTAKIADPRPVTDGPYVALHLGWLDEPDGVRVATWRASEPLDIPVDLRHVLVPDRGGHTGVVRMPARVSDRLAAIASIASERSLALDSLRETLVLWLTEHGPLDHPTREGEQISAADVARWRSPGRFAVLALAWRSRDDAPAIAADLEEWRRVDRAAWERQEHGRRKVLGHRDDLYRQVAAVIGDQARALVVDDTSVSDLARAETDLPAEVERRISARRTIAAPGVLREAVRAACDREGVPVITVAAAGLSRVHAGCGHENPADDRYMSRPVRCDGCGRDYDPDASATVLMLLRALPSDGPAAGGLATG